MYEQGIEFVAVINSDKSVVEFTDVDGYLDISGFLEDNSIYFKHTAYFTYKIKKADISLESPYIPLKGKNILL